MVLTNMLSPQYAYPACYITVHQFRGGTTYSGLFPPTSVINERKKERKKGGRKRMKETEGKRKREGGRKERKEGR